MLSSEKHSLFYCYWIYKRIQMMMYAWFYRFLHVTFSFSISTPHCQFVHSILLYITYNKYWVCKAILVSGWVLRTLFGLVKIRLSKNDSSVSGFFCDWSCKNGSLINKSKIHLNERNFSFFCFSSLPFLVRWQLCHLK